MVSGAIVDVFQHTAARRRLAFAKHQAVIDKMVSTHSRPKAAGKAVNPSLSRGMVSTHSRPKAAGLACTAQAERVSVSTHSRPKAAGFDFN